MGGADRIMVVGHGEGDQIGSLDSAAVKSLLGSSPLSSGVTIEFVACHLGEGTFGQSVLPAGGRVGVYSGEVSCRAEAIYRSLMPPLELFDPDAMGAYIAAFQREPGSTKPLAEAEFFRELAQYQEIMSRLGSVNLDVGDIASPAALHQAIAANFSRLSADFDALDQFIGSIKERFGIILREVTTPTWFEGPS